MAPFLINHQELIHKWINTREAAISRVLSIKSINKNTQKQIISYIEQAYKYTSQWNVDDLIQANRIKNLNLDLKNIINCNGLLNLLNKNYPLKSLNDYYKNKICIETEEILHSIFIEPFPDIIDDLTNQMGSVEKKSVVVGYNVKEIIEIIKEYY